jgi:hypothetical protein
MAERMKAKVRNFAIDHTPLLTAPDKVVDVILAATKATLAECRRLEETRHDG